MSLFDFIKQIQAAGVAAANGLMRGALNFLSPFTVTDDPTNNRFNIGMAAAGGGSAGTMSAADKAFLDALHAAPVALTDANTTLLWSTSAVYQQASATQTADRVFTLGTSDSPPFGALMAITVETQSAFKATLVNGGVSGGNIISGSVQPGQNCAGTWIARFDGTNWKLFQDAGRHLTATSSTAGLMTSVQFSQLAALYQTPTVSYSSGTPTLSAVSNAAETLFFLSGTVSVPKLSAATNWVGLRLVVKAENLSSPVVTADTGNPDLIDGASTYTIPGVYGSAVFYSKSAGVIRAFPGAT
jgi:hypothetical protein